MCFDPILSHVAWPFLWSFNDKRWRGKHHGVVNQAITGSGPKGKDVASAIPALERVKMELFAVT